MGSATARISLKCPTGERLQRTFLASQTLGEVYEWAHCCRLKPDPWNFDFCTNFPARTLTDTTATLETFGLTPNAALLMKIRDD